MAVGLLGTAPVTPASAAETGELPWRTQRQQAVDYWSTGGAGIKEAAEQALLGTDEDIKQFLAGADAIQLADDRVDASRVLNVGGTGVREAAKQALAGAPEDLQAFLNGGWKAPHQQDQRVEVSRLINLGGTGVQDAGKAALNGTPEDVEKFLKSGQYTARQADDRVQVSKIHNTGGTNVKAAAKLALQGTYDDIVEFLEVGQFVARNRDQEHATIAQLTEQAKQAGKQAEDATKAAQEDSERAIAAAELAKQAAEKAAKETEAAKDDAARAAVKAKQAADAARAAAEAAQTAISAANAANRSARVAALAAAQTANAAAAAADAATRAYNAAIAAGKDKNQAQHASDMATAARAAANLATESGKAAEQAGKASLAAASAAAASKSAGTNADLAADAADEAADHAAAAGASSAEARAAAAETRRHATEANRAATAAEALARKSATAASEARDAANSAATHANNAADAAEEAALHAGEAADAAADATKHANAAKIAANAATAAVATAQKTFDIARETEVEDLATRTAAAVEKAKSQKVIAETFTVEISGTVVEGQAIVDDTEALAVDAGKPDADTAALAKQGRAVALRALRQFGSWRQEAAAEALSGTDEDVLEYLRTGWQQAARDEIRQQVTDLASNSPYEAVRTAATAALAGTDQQIRDFYTIGQYEAGLTDYRVLVSQIHNTGGPGVQEKAEAALADGSAQALLAFLNSGQYEARTADERVTASQLVNTGGPEVQATAKIALTGPANELHDFVQAGQYTADRKDQLAYTHIAQVQRLIAEGGIIAAQAQQNRWLAAKAAAEANQAAAEANAAATEAQKSANQAAQYAVEADKSADSAETSATKARQSATTARAAADRAEQDAVAAEESAAQAEFSAEYARGSAAAAMDSAEQARASALAAGKSSDEAEAAASQAWDRVIELREAEEAAARRAAEEQRKQEREKESKPRCYLYPTRDSLPPCALAGQPIAVPEIDPIMKEIVWELLGLNDAKECAKDPALGKCTLAAVSFLPIGKLKLLKKGIEAVEDIAGGTRAAKAAEKCTQCFRAGTKVLMADSSTKNIESVNVGDRVIATDPITGETGSRAVTNLIVTEHDKFFNEITVATRQGQGRITATHEHPFWSPSEKAWVETAALREGMTLRTVDKSLVTVQGNRSFSENARTYNLTVAGLHTYYVLAGATPVLVHNSSCDLLLHEAAGGHAIARHVGRTDAQLIARNIPYSSTFKDLAAAEKATGGNITANQGAIIQWLSGSERRKVITNPMDSAGGRVYERSTQTFHNSSQVRTVLERDPSMPDKYRIITSYPEK